MRFTTHDIDLLIAQLAREVAAGRVTLAAAESRLTGILQRRDFSALDRLKEVVHHERQAQIEVAMEAPRGRLH